jgi:carbamoyltransferase
MKLLTLRLCEHDSNISYFDGESVRYFKSERFFQQKYHAFNNLNDWKDVVREIWDLDIEKLDEVAIIYDPWNYEEEDTKLFFPAVPFKKLSLKCPVYRINHHYAHALSSWMLSKKSCVHFVIDGFGEEDVTWTIIKDNKIVDIGKISECGSIGIEMHKVGDELGVECSYGGYGVAGKLMGLQSYGNIDKTFRNKLSGLGIKNINEIFDFNRWVEHKSNSLVASHTKLDWISTIHDYIGNMLVEFFSQYVSEEDNITYSGGVAQNIIWNTKIKQKFPNLIIPPHCGDEGLSLGALEWLRIKNNLPEFSLSNFPFSQSDESTDDPCDKLIKDAAKLLSDGKIVAWYQGNGEVGPRALGNRSILMDPRIENGKEKMNLVKNRESYRPFGASVLQEYKHSHFISLPDNPFMLFVAKPLQHLPAITHCDGTCRAQTVDSNTSFGKLLKQFFNNTGCPVLLNTSLNLAGKPITASKKDAILFFEMTEIDALVIGNTLYKKQTCFVNNKSV